MQKYSLAIAILSACLFYSNLFFECSHRLVFCYHLQFFSPCVTHLYRFRGLFDPLAPLYAVWLSQPQAHQCPDFHSVLRLHFESHFLNSFSSKLSFKLHSQNRELSCQFEKLHLHCLESMRAFLLIWSDHYCCRYLSETSDCRNRQYKIELIDYPMFADREVLISEVKHLDCYPLSRGQSSFFPSED